MVEDREGTFAAGEECQVKSVMGTTPLEFIERYLVWLDEALNEYAPERRLSRIQQYWLKFCLMGVLFTNTVCWAAFARAGLVEYRLGSVSWMFRRSRIDWDRLWSASVSVIHGHNQVPVLIGNPLMGGTILVQQHAWQGAAFSPFAVNFTVRGFLNRFYLL